MPLTFQAPPDSRTSSLLNSKAALAIVPDSCRHLVRSSASPLRPILSLSSLTLTSGVLACRSILGGPRTIRKWKNSNKTCSYYGSSGKEEEDLDSSKSICLVEEAEDDQVVSSDRRAESVKVAVLAGLLALQFCLPAVAESLGIEVARSSDSSGFAITDWTEFENGFSSAFLLIFFSEIGDKTFFIAALLATRKSNLAVFTGTFGALAAMTVISVALGRAFHYVDNLIPISPGRGQFPFDDLAAVVLLVYFGVSTLVDAVSMEGSKAENEKQDAELAIAGVAGDGNLGVSAAAASTVVATFALVFVAEWGDKSFFSTIALAAASSPVGVVTGAIAGHGVATILAVLGGKFLSEYVSEKLIAYVGGALFLVFAATTLVDILKA